MERINKAYIIGLGAIGGLYSSIIHDKHPEKISIIADYNRVEKYTNEGITINNIKYSFNYVFPEQGAQDAELILIAVKYHQLKRAVENVRSYVGENTIILSLLNGIDSEEYLRTSLSRGKILYSYCVGTDAVRSNQDIKFNNKGKIVFGSDDVNRDRNELFRVEEFFSSVGIPYYLSPNIKRDLWWKYMMNVGINQTSAVLKANYGVFKNIEAARELMTAASKEVVEISNKIGIGLNEEDLIESLKIIDTLASEGKTSMCQDIEAGRKTEVEIFGDRVVELGEKYGVNTPINKLLSNLIHIQESMQK